MPNNSPLNSKSNTPIPQSPSAPDTNTSADIRSLKRRRRHSFSDTLTLTNPSQSITTPPSVHRRNPYTSIPKASDRTSPEDILEDQDESDIMFARMSSALRGRGGMGMAGGMVQVELQQLKSAPVLNPHYGMVMKYLDCLNRLMDPLLMASGAAGVKSWLIEVQTLIRLLQKRTFQRIPLTGPERHAILTFANYWRNMSSPPYCMNRPEAQLVLIALTEFATR